MDLAGLAEILRLLPRDDSYWQLVVHPSQADDARIEVIKARMVGRVLVDTSPDISPDTLGLSAPVTLPAIHHWWDRFRRQTA